ncbi:MAG: aminopeptidase P family protein [Actinobacteria bacterium]|nr:aminopeptidase P family protein [Actinomycetota bacterium]
MRRDRRRMLVDAMAANSLDALVLLGQNNVGYATGARAPVADAARAGARRMVAIVTPDDTALFTSFPDGVPPELSDEQVLDSLPLESDIGARALVDALPEGKLGFDELTMPLRAALDGREALDAAVVLSAAKTVKTPDEIECIRRAQAINEEAMLAVEGMLAPGVYATALTGCFLRRVFELGATSNTVEPIFQVMPRRIADGPYSATGDLVFPTVTKHEPVGEGDVIWVDTGIDYHGYKSDFGRTWVVGGQVDERRRDQFRRWRGVVDRVLEVVKPGATAADLTRAAGEVDGRRPWLAHLYLAHGTGTDSAEMPLIGTDLGSDFDEGVVLVPGMVTVFEPVIWDDGHAGYRSEEIVAVTDDGYTMLSNHHYAPYE